MGKQPQLPGSQAKDVMCKRWDTPFHMVWQSWRDRNQ
jgi:hypothetical protein